jgi:RNA polymerase sigma factor (sigma-70 family)
MRPMDLRNENLLIWNNFRNGDPHAYASLIRIHYQDLFNYATRFTKDTSMAKDCLQELFFWLWKNRLTINETVFLKYYLLKALRRLLIHARLTSNNFNFYNTSYPFETASETGLPVENIIIRNEETAALSEKIKKILVRLSKREQEVIYLRLAPLAKAYAEVTTVLKADIL